MPEATTIPLASSDKIGHVCLPLPWEIQKSLVTLQAHCVAIVDEQPTAKVRELVSCISQGILELAQELRSNLTR